MSIRSSAELVMRCARAAATNQVAGVAPELYLRLTGQTGRGDASLESPEDIADYFHRCYEDYCRAVGVHESQRAGWLSGKTVLEYGPGDLPGVALLMVANGARKVYCVDRFPMVRLSSKNLDAIAALRSRCAPRQQAQIDSCFIRNGDPSTGFAVDRIEYLVNPRGLSGLREVADLAISRAVLEHVNDLAATFEDLDRALIPGGISAHLVDLKSHGLHVHERLDFLTWPNWLWALMYSNKGSPNRLRPSTYREAIAKAGLSIRSMIATDKATQQEIERVRPRLARAFRMLDPDDIGWLGFWLIAEKPRFAPSE